MSAVRRSHHQFEEVLDIFHRGVFASQRTAMLRYVRAVRGLSVEPPAESLPAPFGRGCQRLAGRSLRSRKSSPFLCRSLSMLQFARAVPSEAACFAPHLRGFFFRFALRPFGRAFASRFARRALAARRPVSGKASLQHRLPLFSSHHATIAALTCWSRRSGPCCRYATARPSPLACFLDQHVASAHQVAGRGTQGNGGSSER